MLSDGFLKFEWEQIGLATGGFRYFGIANKRDHDKHAAMLVCVLRDGKAHHAAEISVEASGSEAMWRVDRQRRRKLRGAVSYVHKPPQLRTYFQPDSVVRRAVKRYAYFNLLP